MKPNSEPNFDGRSLHSGPSCSSTAFPGSVKSSPRVSGSVQVSVKNPNVFISVLGGEKNANTSKVHFL